jgi:hypothetical protein
MYFEKSQEIKAEIEGRNDILDLTAGAFNGEIEEFAGAGVDLFRIGKLESGLHLALRVFRDFNNYKQDLEARFMEHYALNAEKLQGESERVPLACVGAFYRDKKAALITEDLTAGGEFEVEHHSDNAYGFILKPEGKEKVWIDIDAVFSRRDFDEIRYMDLQNSINIS